MDSIDTLDKKNQINLTRVNNPFQRSDAASENIVYLGNSIADIAGQYFPSNVRVAVSINGMVIEKEFWAATVPRPGDQIVVVPVVGDDEDGILALAAMVTISLLAPGVGNLLATGAWAGKATLWSTIYAAGFAVAGGMLINSIMGPEPPKSPNFNNDYDRSQSYGWNQQTTQAQGLVIPRWYGRNKLSGNVVAVHTDVDGTDNTKQTIKLLAAFGSGPVQGNVAGSIRLNNQPIANLSDVTTEEKKGTLNQSVVSFFGDTKPEYRPAIKVTNTGGAKIYTTPDADFDDLEIELLFPGGLYFYNAQGNLADHSVDIKIEISVHDAASWSTLVDETITENKTGPVRKAYAASGSHTGGSPVSITNGTKYDIRITKDTSDETGAEYGDDLYLGAVREVINDNFIYPGIPLLGISALANDQLSGNIQISLEQDGRIVNTFDGTSWTLQFSTNLAWVIYDLMTLPVISGDGGGTPYAIERYDGLDPDRLITDSFYELAQFCATQVDDGNGGTEDLITFNGGFDVGVDMWTAVLKVCQVARCTPVRSGNKYRIVIDKARTATQIFSVGNIKQGTFKETYLPQADRINAIEVHYKDAKQDYKRMPLTLYNPNITGKARQSTIELFGTDRQSQAWRAANFRLAINEFLKSTIEFGVNIDAIRSEIGDVIKVQHDIMQSSDEGGLIVSGGTDHFIADHDIVYEDGTVYGTEVRLADDTLESKLLANGYETITAVDTGARTFTIATDKSAQYKQGDRIRVADSGPNDRDYTLKSDSVFSAATVITVVEQINDPTIAGGLFNLRRVVPTVAFSAAPGLHDVYMVGITNQVGREFSIIDMRKTADQMITITATGYSASFYANDTATPQITTLVSTDPPLSDDETALAPPSWENIQNRYPHDLVTGKVPTIDTPLVTNLKFNDDTPSGGSVSWSKADTVNPIVLTYKGISYEIAVGNTANTFIYWSLASPTVFLSTNTLTTAIGADKWLMAVNDSGTASIAKGFPVLHAGLLQADTITAAFGQIADLTIETAKIVNLNVTTIKIADEATSLQESDSIAAELTVYDAGGAPTEIIDLTNFPSVGSGVVEVFVQCEVWNDEPLADDWSFIVERGTTDKFTKVISIPSQTWFGISFTAIDNPGAGNVDYNIDADPATPDPDSKVRNRLIVVKENKGK